MKNRKPPAGAKKIPPIPPQILSGAEPIAERYSGNWQPLETKKRTVTTDDLERVTAEMDSAMLNAEIGTARATGSSEPMIWKGSQRELAKYMVDLWREGKIEAESEQDVLRQTSKHFAIKKGQPLKPDSLRVNLRQKRDKDRGIA